MQINIYPTKKEVAEQTAIFFAQQAEKYISAQGRFTVALSGGSTPLQAYALLKNDPFKKMIDWKNIFFFWGDERYVPADSPENNAYMARKIFLDELPVPAENIFPVNTNLSPAASALDYETIIKKHFKNKAIHFDLILLGLGTEGHTASLFPASDLLKENIRIVREVYVESKDQYRISFTLPIINTARTIAFVVNGKEKSNIISNIMHAGKADENIPASCVQPESGELFWILDEEAASLLPDE